MKLEEIVPWGRTLTEYRSMFGLVERDLNLKILERLRDDVSKNRCRV